MNEDTRWLVDKMWYIVGMAGFGLFFLILFLIQPLTIMIPILLSIPINSDH